MATFTIIKMTHFSPLHIGTGKENYDFSASDLQSDTLLSALAAIRAQMGQSEDLNSFLSSFLLSSAFPFYENRYFLPKMQGRIKVTVQGKVESEYRKSLKKIHYIESELWQKLARGETVELENVQQIQGDLLLKKQDRISVCKSQVSERVSVSRAVEDTEPFFFDWNFFDRKAGLYCLTDAKDDLLEEIIRLFTFLGETGLGTDKNVGGGKFSVETDTLSVDDIRDANATQLLSLYIPVKDEIGSLNLSQSKYTLLLRGGYMAGSREEDLRHLRKKSIYAFGVGSVFPTMQPLKGKVVDLRPDWNDDRMHAVLRSGRPFCLPVKLN